MSKYETIGYYSESVRSCATVLERRELSASAYWLAAWRVAP